MSTKDAVGRGVQAVEDARDAAVDAMQALKPRLRGWLHLGTAPFALVATAVLVALAPTTQARVAATVFGATAVLLFGVSALYHRGRWSPRTNRLLKRLDHANIFLIIAGTYTPLAVLCLEGTPRTVLLVVMWTAAVLGVVFRIVWTTAPRWLFVPVYVGIGLAGVGYVPGIWMESLPVGILVVTGGALYIIGAVVYGIKRPNPAPAVFGFHEIFHTFTVLGYGCHLAALLVAASHAY